MSTPRIRARRALAHAAAAFLVAGWTISGDGIAATLNLRDAPGLTATLDTGESACAPVMALDIHGRTAEDFAPGNRVLPKVMAWAQTNVGMSCPRAAALQVRGTVEGVVVYQGSAAATDGWTLVESRAATSVARATPTPPAPPANVGPTATAPGRSAPAVAAAPAPGNAPPAGAVAACDRLAAHPDDPEAVAPGVADAKLDAKAVVKACAEAVAIDRTPRLHFQLARGYLKAKRHEDAVEQLLAAAEQDHGGALAYLGDLQLDGAPGIQPDPVRARALYARAVDSQFMPAAKVLAEFEDYTDRVAAADLQEQQSLAAAQAKPTKGKAANTTLLNPGLVEPILAGNLDGVPYNERYVKAYLINMAENIGEVCEAHFTAREVKQLKLEAAARTDMSAGAGVATLYGMLANMARASQNPNAVVRERAQASMDADDLPDEAMKDAFALMTRHPCKSKPLSDFSRHLVAYVHNEGAPLVGADDMLRTCRRDAGIANAKQANDYCMCFLGSAAVAPMSRAERKGLSSNFRETASQIRQRYPDQYAACRI